MEKKKCSHCNKKAVYFDIRWQDELYNLCDECLYYHTERYDQEVERGLEK